MPVDGDHFHTCIYGHFRFGLSKAFECNCISTASATGLTMAVICVRISECRIHAYTRDSCSNCCNALLTAIFVMHDHLICDRHIRPSTSCGYILPTATKPLLHAAVVAHTGIALGQRDGNGAFSDRKNLHLTDLQDSFHIGHGPCVIFY